MGSTRQFAAACRARGVECRTHLPSPAAHTVIDVVVFAANLPVASIKVGQIPPQRPEWRRVVAYWAAQLPVFHVPLPEANAWLDAWQARDVPALARWRVAGNVRAAAVAPF